MVGGHSAVTSKDISEVRHIAKAVQEQVERRLSTKYELFEATQYRRQVVAGMNYHIKVLTKQAGAINGCVHLRIFRPLPHTGLGPELHGVQVKEENDELDIIAVDL